MPGAKKKKTSSPVAKGQKPAAGDARRADPQQPNTHQSRDYAHLLTSTNLLIGGGVLLMLFVFLIFLFYNIGLSQGRLTGDEAETATPVALLVETTPTRTPSPSPTPVPPQPTPTPTATAASTATATPDSGNLAERQADDFAQRAAAALS
ncbi:MAG: hypothetical protein WBO46_13220, partial [Caldilineaceae bacterium]